MCSHPDCALPLQLGTSFGDPILQHFAGHGLSLEHTEAIALFGYKGIYRSISISTRSNTCAVLESQKAQNEHRVLVCADDAASETDAMAADDVADEVLDNDLIIDAIAQNSAAPNDAIPKSPVDALTDARGLTDFATLFDTTKRPKPVPASKETLKQMWQHPANPYKELGIEEIREELDRRRLMAPAKCNSRNLVFLLLRDDYEIAQNPAILGPLTAVWENLFLRGEELTVEGPDAMGELHLRGTLREAYSRCYGNYKRLDGKKLRELAKSRGLEVSKTTDHLKLCMQLLRDDWEHNRLNLKATEAEESGNSDYEPKQI